MPIYSNDPLTTYHSGGRSPAYAVAHGDVETRREWLLDRIAYVNFVETPLLHSLEKVSSDNTLVEWTMDRIADPRTRHGTTPANIQALQEDADIDPTPVEHRTRVCNFSHIWGESFRVTDTQRLMNEVGTSDEYNLQAWKAFLRLGTMFEYILMWSQEAAGSYTAGGASVARKMMGIFGWGIETGDTGGDATICGRTVPDIYSGTHYAGTGGDLTVDELYDEMLEPAYDKAMNLDQAIFLCGAKVKRVISQFALVYSGSGATLTATPLNERTVPAAARRLVDSIDVFQTDVGPIYVNKTRYMNGSETRSGFGSAGATSITVKKSAVCLETPFFKIPVIQGFHIVPLARQGLTSQAVVVGQLSLICHNPRAMFTAIDIAA
jgi:hypothetical protein